MDLSGSFHQRRERVQTIDLIKGIDMILMVFFNYSVTLRYFGLLHMQPDLFYGSFPIIIASIFIFLSGVAASASFENNNENFGKRYFMRGVRLLILAAFITLFTFIFVPEGTVYFGILHFFAVTSFIVPFFIKHNKLSLIAAISIILSGIYLQMREFDLPYLLWLGFMPENFSTFDYFPLIPWLGVLLLGIFFGKDLIGRTGHIKFKSRISAAFIFLGKNSLAIYLIHQPALVFLLMISGFIA